MWIAKDEYGTFTMDLYKNVTFANIFLIYFKLNDFNSIIIL